jgi:hypothetical protein
MKKPKNEKETISVEVGDFTVFVTVGFTRVNDEKMWHHYEVQGIERPEQVSEEDSDLTEEMIETAVAEHYQYLAENCVEPPMDALAFVIQSAEDLPAGVEFSDSGLEKLKLVKAWFVAQGGILPTRLPRRK